MSPGPFFGLDVASRALRTAQTLVDVTNQNVANANTPGYSRQAAAVKATAPYPIPVFRQSGDPGQMGRSPIERPGRMRRVVRCI